MGLPKPYFERAGIQLFCGDCRELLPLLERGRVDLVLTDPPYGHGAKWSGGTWAANPIYDAAFDWDCEPVDDSTLARVIALADDAIVWGGNYYALPPSRCWLAWVKNQILPTMADAEFAWTSFNRPSKIFDSRRNPDGKRHHPTQKPLALFRWCLAMKPNAAVVCDPFTGSGTTLLAAAELGRRCIGIEREERYCEIAAKRLESYQPALPLPEVAD